jgi:hypothetical protein
MSLVHLHLLLSHVPVIGVLFSLIPLAAGMALRSEPLKKAGLIAFALLAPIALAVFPALSPLEERRSLRR